MLFCIRASQFSHTKWPQKFFIGFMFFCLQRGHSMFYLKLCNPNSVLFSVSFLLFSSSLIYSIATFSYRALLFFPRSLPNLSVVCLLKSVFVLYGFVNVVSVWEKSGDSFSCDENVALHYSSKIRIMVSLSAVLIQNVYYGFFFLVDKVFGDIY